MVCLTEYVGYVQVNPKSDKLALWCNKAAILASGNAISDRKDKSEGLSTRKDFVWQKNFTFHAIVEILQTSKNCIQ